jgi:small GTP-binding protein
MDLDIRVNPARPDQAPGHREEERGEQQGSVPLTANFDLVKKVCLIGDPGVGKTSLIRRFVTDLFDDHYITTIGAKITKKVVVVELPERDLLVNMNLMIWDLAGQKEYKVFHEMHLKGMEGVLAVADLTRKNTFDSLKAAIQMADRTRVNIPMVFLLNKCDLAEPSDVDLKDIRMLASQRAIPVLATSAKTGLNVELSFSRLARMMAEAWAEKKFQK